jgi:hypothetical protein
MLEALLSAHWYLAAQAGYGYLSGEGTQTHIEKDVNLGWPWEELHSGPSPSALVGVRRERFGFELEYARLGHYTRRIDLSEGPDVANENVKVYALSLRGLYFPAPYGRLQAFAFAQVSALPYERAYWEGHEIVNGAAKVVASRAPCLAAGNDPYDCNWIYSSGISWAAGAGVGMTYALTKHWSIRGETSFLVGEFEAISARAGVQFNF